MILLRPAEAGQATWAAAEASDEARLVARARTGEPDALATIFELYSQRVYRHAYFLSGDADEADDIVQETFLRAHRAIARFRADSSLTTWLLRIATNLCQDRQRRRRSHPEIPLSPDLVAPHLDPAAQAERAELVNRLLRILHGMPIADRTVLVLHLLEEFDYGQMGEVLGCSRNSAKMRTLRALHRFRERVASYFEESR
jgi:RNA polymerase sigma-70 factor (ECF subfamily)